MDTDAWVDECLKDVPDFVVLGQKLAGIFGTTVGSDGSVNITFSFTAPTRQEAKAKVAELKLQLLQLKTEIVQARQKLNAAFERMMNPLPKTMKSVVRQQQISGRQNYTTLIQSIDSLLLQLRTIKDV